MRDVDRWIFGRHRARAMIDVPKEGQRDYARLERIVADIGTGEVATFFVHLAEGRRDNPRSVEEWELVDPPGGGVRALTAATVIIHGSALAASSSG